MTPSNQRGDSPRHQLFSPEGVHLDLPIAGPAPRMFAYMIDFALMLLLILLLVIALFVLMPIGSAVEQWWKSIAADDSGAPTMDTGLAVGLLVAVFVLAQFLIETGYFIFWEMVTNGRSPGKALAGLRVVRRNGLPIDLRSSVIRNLMRIVDVLPANYFVGLISIIVSASGERIGDHAAGTIVVRLDRPEAAPELIFSADLGPAPFTRQQLARVGPRELTLVRGTLRRLALAPRDSAQPDPARAELLAEVAESIRLQMGLAELPSPDRIEFLRSVLRSADRYSR